MLEFTEHLMGYKPAVPSAWQQDRAASAAMRGLQRDGCDGLTGQGQGQARLPLPPRASQGNERDDMGYGGG